MIQITRMSLLLVEILSKIGEQKNTTNTRLRETGKQNELTLRKFLIWITKTRHLLNNEIN